MEESKFSEAVGLLKKLISVSSFSNEENEAADIWEGWLKSHGVKNEKRFHNNVYAISEKFDPSKPVLLLNSHLDTVKPVSSYSRNPFQATIEDGKLYGLGSNDAGGAGVSLAVNYLKFKDRSDLPFNLLLAITASEEKMGEFGMRSFLPHIKEEGLYPHMAVVGEPTGCQAAIAERGLVVCDAIVRGKAAHAARNEGINSIYRACKDIEILQNIKWDKTSDILGPVKVSVTMISAGTQHNIVPDICSYVVDIRTTDAYTNEETVDYLRTKVEWSEFTPRSTRIRASVLPYDHPLMKASKIVGLETFVSPTTSDMALMYDIPSIKIGPGKSERSHTADEYIELNEILAGIDTYEKILNSLSLIL